MNAPMRTRAAEGFDRRAFTVADVRAMIDAGIMDPDERVELWEGEFVPMNSKYNRHEIWKRRLNRILVRAFPDEIAIAVEPSLYLSDITFVEPDLLIHADALLPEDVRGPDVMLVIEIADSSINKDLRAKARIYAKYGVRHYWVLDPENRRAHLLSEPGENGYGATQVVETDGVITLPFEPAITIRLVDLG